jgi:glycosyltransferase involved in cell wall biosynthesis
LRFRLEHHLSDQPPIDVSIVSPVHNEVRSLLSLVERTVAVMQQYPHIQGWEHILVDDGSTDGSFQVMRKLQAQYSQVIRVEQHPRRLGQKHCYQTGLSCARGWLTVLMDADLQVLPEELPLVLDKAVLGGCEMVCTYSDPARGGKHRGLVSLLGNRVFMRLVFKSPVRDATANFMALQTHYLRGVELIANDQRYLLPIAMRRGLTRIGEVGCVFASRQHGKSKYSKWKKMLQGLPEMIALRRRLASGFYDQPRTEPLKLTAPATALAD